MNSKKFYSEEELYTLLESVTDLVIVGDKDGVYRCNKLVYSFFNVSTIEELNTVLPSFGGYKIIQDVHTGLKLEFSELPFNKALSGEDYKMDISCTNLNSESKIFFHCHGVPIKHQDNVVGAVLILTDYTYEILARDAIKNALDNVEEIKILNSKLEQFGSSIAHDINSPLNNIQGLSHYLLEEYRAKLDPMAISFLEMIYSSSQRLTEYVISLLKLSTLNNADIQKEWINLDSSIESINSELKYNNPNYHHTFNYEKGMSVFADKNLIYGVLHNLITNAYKFSTQNENPKISIGIETNENNRQILYIKDNGLGFNESDKDHIFVPKFRTELSSKYPGKGIGLATVQQIINSHNGRIWAKGKPGEGATFYIYLPEEELQH